MNLENNTILITGGTSGFGLEFTKRLIALGNTVIITGRNKDKLDEVKKLHPNVHAFVSDVSDPQAIVNLYETVVKQFPMLNMIINNAGEMRKLNLNNTSGNLLDITREIDINLSGPIRLIQQFLPHLKKQSNAAILNVTSGLALIPFPLSPIYTASKAGLRFYTKSLRVQLKDTGIKVFELIAPAAKTGLGDKFVEVPGYDPKMEMDVQKLIDVAIKGLGNDKYEIYPGMAKLMNVFSRLAPSVLFNQMAKLATAYIAMEKSK
jgi:uncharacterized oxidoreductase